MDLEEKAPGGEYSCFHILPFPDSEEKEGDRKQGSEDAPIFITTTTPLPESTLVSLSGPQLVHSLWHCEPVSAPTHICTHTHQLSHMHTQAHIHTNAWFPFRVYLGSRIVSHLHHHPLLQGVPLAHSSPRPSPRLGTRWHSQAFEKRVNRAGSSPETGYTEYRICSYKALVQHRFHVLIVWFLSCLLEEKKKKLTEKIVFLFTFELHTWSSKSKLLVAIQVHTQRCSVCSCTICWFVFNS